MKRHISLLLAVFMLATLLPMGVMADGEATLVAPVPDIPVSGEISTIAGEIALDFAAEIDEATLGGIAITATTEAKTFEGGLVAEVDGTDASIVHVKFGNLEDGVAYKLTVPATVKDVNGNYLAEPEEFPFTAKTEWLSNTDFSEADYVVGSAPTQEMDNLMYAGGGNYTTDYARVMEETVGQDQTDKFVRVGPRIGAGAETGASGAAGILFSADTTANLGGKLYSKDVIDGDKVVVIEAGVRADVDRVINKAAGTSTLTFGNDAKRTMGMDYNSGTTGTVGGNTATQRVLALWYGSKTYYGKTDNITPAGDFTRGAVALTNPDVTSPSAEGYGFTGGWYQPKIVLKRDSNEKTNKYVYDNNQSGKYLGKVSTEHAFNTNLTKFGIMSWYASTTPVYADVTYVRVHRERLLSPFGTSEYDAENKKITVYMTDDIDSSTVSTTTVSVKMGTTPVAISSAEVDETGRGITLTFPTELGNGDYTVSVAGLKDADGIFGYDTDFDFNVNVIESLYLVAPDISVAEGDISVIEGELVITFTPGTILRDDVDELITFKKGDDAIKGLCKVEKDSVAPHVVRVTFGKLEEGADYTLTIPATVGSTDEKYLENPVTINYTARTEYMTNTDFSDTSKYTVGSSPAQYTDSLMYANLDKYSTTGALIMQEANTNETDDTDEYVRVQAGGNGAAGVLFSADSAANPDATLFDTETINNEKVVVIESAVRIADASEARSTGMHYNAGLDGAALTGAATKQRVAYYNKTGTPLEFYGRTWTESTNPDAAITRDEVYGWYDTTMVLRRHADGKTYKDIYDNATGEKLAEDTNGESATSTKTKVGIMSWYSQGTNSADVTYVRVRKEKLLSVIEKTAYTNDGKQVVLYMSDDIDESTIGTLSVVNSIGNNDKVNVTPDYSNRTVTLTFPDGLIIGDHSVDISGLKSKTTGLYASDTAVTISVSEEEAVADEINNNIGIITLSFDKAVDPATINGISFTKATGAKITGAVIREVDEADDKKVNIKFGKLEDGVEYKLTVSASVKYTDGSSVVDENRTYRYLAKAQYFTNTDFSTEDGYTVGNALTNGKDNILYIVNSNNDTTDVSVVADAQTGNQYIRMNIGSTVNHGVYVRKDADNSRFNDYTYLNGANVYVIEAGVKATMEKTQFRTGRMLKYDGASVSQHNDGPSVNYSMILTNKLMLEYSVNPANADNKLFTQADGWSHLVYVVKQGMGDHNTTPDDALMAVTLMDIYDGANDTYMGTTTKGKSSYFDINAIGITDAIASDSLKVGDYADIDYIRVRADRLMTVLDDGKNTNDYDAGQREVVINLTDDVKASSLETITVKDSENTPANISNISLSEDKRSITIEFADDLYSGSYTVDLSGVTNEQGILPYDTEFTFVVDSTVPYVKKTPSSYVETGTSATLSAELFNYKEACVAYIAVYDGDQLVKIEPATVEDYVDEETTPTRTIEASITLPSSFAGTKAVKLFVWKDFETLEPITRVFNCL